MVSRMRIRMRGLIHVCRKERSFHLRTAERTFRLLERRGTFAWEGRWISDQRCEHTCESRIGLCTGVKGGEANVGVGSSVDKADAPVSPLSSPPRPLDFRRGRGLYALSILRVREGLCWRIKGPSTTNSWISAQGSALTSGPSRCVACKPKNSARGNDR